MIHPRLPALACLLLVVAGSAHAAKLSRVESRIAATATTNLPRSIELLAETVDAPSATENTAGVRKAGAIYARELAALGFETSWLELPPE